MLESVKKKLKWAINIVFSSLYPYVNSTIKAQLEDPFKIPVLIINFNQLYYLKQLVGRLTQLGHKNIIIIDNQSTYPPLLAYYRSVGEGVKVEYMERNYGHNVFYKNKQLQKKYGGGFFILTDADIVPGDRLPANYLRFFISQLRRNVNKIVKIGFALRIDDIPDSYELKSKVLQWEAKYWQHELEKDVYLADIDTTFALYQPMYPRMFSNISMFSGIRVAGDYTAKHGGWYPMPESDEWQYYRKTANSSNSWKTDESGNVTGSHKHLY